MPDNEKHLPPHTPDSSASSDSSHSIDTGALAEQLAEEEDPLRIKLRDSFEEEDISFASPRRRSQRHRNRVRILSDCPGQHKATHTGLVKEDIEIPNPVARKAPRSQRILAAIMSRGKRGEAPGLTGKPLL